MALTLPRAGELNRRVQIRKREDFPDTTTGTAESYTDAPGERWAKVEPVHGLANRAGAQTGEMPTHLVWVRWSIGTKPEDFTTSHVIEWGGHRYRVLDAIDANDVRLFTRVSVKDLGVI